MSTSSRQTDPTTRLPTPAERPSADVIIYDGHCRFCSAQMWWIARLDRGQKLAFLSLHEEEVGRRFGDLTHQQLMDQMVLIDRHGRRHGGAAAFRYLTRLLPWLWPLAGPMHIPRSLPLWQWVYHQIARRRYWFGRTDDCEDGACRMHGK